jgi:hypothetical protein
MNDLDFYIELNSRLPISKDDEDNIYGVKKFSIDIKKYNEEQDNTFETIGKVSLIKINTNGNALTVLDYLEESGVFALVFNENWEFTDKVKENYENLTDDLLFSPIGSIYILNRIELNEKYRRNNLSKKVFDCIKETLNINTEYILLKAYPLQHESQNENFNEEQFLVDREKLIALYKDWGFTQIYNDCSHSIMIKDTQYI